MWDAQRHPWGGAEENRLEFQPGERLPQNPSFQPPPGVTQNSPTYRALAQGWGGSSDGGVCSAVGLSPVSLIPGLRSLCAHLSLSWRAGARCGSTPSCPGAGSPPPFLWAAVADVRTTC